MADLRLAAAINDLAACPPMLDKLATDIRQDLTQVEADLDRLERAMLIVVTSKFVREVETAVNMLKATVRCVVDVATERITGEADRG